jgi:translation initiation factor 2B subunit (eIF-2B alpha/beta/delta family)
MFVACETLKFDARFDVASWPAPRTGNLFDLTPGPLVTTVVTERGTYAPEIIRTMLAPSRVDSAKTR